MGGEGSMAYMIASLRDNKRLLRRKRLFEKERTFLNIKKEYYKASQGRIDFKKASPTELKKIREKVIANRKSENRTKLIVFCFSFFFIGIIISKIIEVENNRANMYNESNLEIEWIEKTEKYLFFITDGDKWIQNKNWNNAVFQYKEALKIFPDEYDANYRLVLAYSYLCQNKNLECKKGEKLVQKLKKQFPDKNEILEIETIFKQNFIE